MGPGPAEKDGYVLSAAGNFGGRGGDYRPRKGGRLMNLDRKQTLKLVNAVRADLLQRLEAHIVILFENHLSPEEVGAILVNAVTQTAVQTAAALAKTVAIINKKTVDEDALRAKVIQVYEAIIPVIFSIPDVFLKPGDVTIQYDPLTQEEYE
jgi:hypothetical protein